MQDYAKKDSHTVESVKSHDPKATECCSVQRLCVHSAVMSGVDDVFAADILYHDYCCKAYFNKFQARIAEIIKT